MIYLFTCQYHYKTPTATFKCLNTPIQTSSPLSGYLIYIGIISEAHKDETQERERDRQINNDSKSRYIMKREH